MPSAQNYSHAAVVYGGLLQHLISHHSCVCFCPLSQLRGPEGRNHI